MRVQQHPLLAGGGAVCPNFAAGQILSIHYAPTNQKNMKCAMLIK